MFHNIVIFWGTTQESFGQGIDCGVEMRRVQGIDNVLKRGIWLPIIVEWLGVGWGKFFSMVDLRPATFSILCDTPGCTSEMGWSFFVALGIWGLMCK